MLLRQIISGKLFGTPAGIQFDVRNTLFSNILRANSFLAIFCADFFRHHGANSSILKDLEVRSGLFLLQIDPPKTLGPGTRFCATNLPGVAPPKENQ
jgi:hypothetical protein